MNLLNKEYFKLIGTRCQGSSYLEGFACVHPEATAVLFPKKDPAHPICAITILGDGGRSLLTKRTGAKGQFQAVFSREHLSLTFAITNLLTGSELIKADILQEDIKVDWVNNDKKGINQANEIRSGQTCIVKADQRHGSRKIIISGLEKEDNSKLTVVEDEASEAPKADKFYVNVVCENPAKQFMDGETSWRPVESFIIAGKTEWGRSAYEERAREEGGESSSAPFGRSPFGGSPGGFGISSSTSLGGGPVFGASLGAPPPPSFGISSSTSLGGAPKGLVAKGGSSFGASLGGSPPPSFGGSPGGFGISSSSSSFSQATLVSGVSERLVAKSSPSPSTSFGISCASISGRNTFGGVPVHKPQEYAFSQQESSDSGMQVDITEDQVGGSQAAVISHGEFVAVNTVETGKTYAFDKMGERLVFGISICPELKNFDYLPHANEVQLMNVAFDEIIEANKIKIVGDIETVYKEENCVFCIDLAPTHLVARCGHQCVCAECLATVSKSVKICPMCRAKVIGFFPAPKE